VLDVDYGHYRLSGDLVCPDNPSHAAVTITGKRVHLNLSGFTITRDDDTGVLLTEGILVRGANAHINGGSVVDFNCPATEDPDCAGIFLGEAPGARINGMSLHNHMNGILSFSFGGIVGNADGARIHGNDITANLRGGIVLSGFGGATAEGAKITGNDLSDTVGVSSGAGYCYLGSSDGVSVIGNIANRCAGAGILLFGNETSGWAERNTVRDNTTLENGRAGISCLGRTEATRPRDNLIQSNTSFGNSGPDLNDGVIVGTTTDCLNTWKDNDFDVARVDCIE
jgi:hypothetical protein